MAGAGSQSTSSGPYQATQSHLRPLVLGNTHGLSGGLPGWSEAGIKRRSSSEVHHEIARISSTTTQDKRTGRHAMLEGVEATLAAGRPPVDFRCTTDVATPSDGAGSPSTADMRTVLMHRAVTRRYRWSGGPHLHISATATTSPPARPTSWFTLDECGRALEHRADRGAAPAPGSCVQTRDETYAVMEVR